MNRLCLLLLVACSSKAATPAAPPPVVAKQPDACETTIAKLVGTIKRKYGKDVSPDERTQAIDSCRKTPKDPTITCVAGAADDDAVVTCMAPPPTIELPP